MKKTIAIVAGAAIMASAAFAAPAFAQSKAAGPFADVPTDHWAYSSVEALRNAGIVIGYPDGTYGGAKKLTRYEFATAVARLIKLIPDANTLASKSSLSSLELKSDLPDFNKYANKSDVDAFNSEIVARLSSNQKAIDALKEAVGNLRPELTQLGVNIDAANAKIDALNKRLDKIQQEVDRIKITADINVIVRSDINTKSDGYQPISQDGYSIGDIGGGNKIASTSIFNSPKVYNDILLNIAGKVNDTTKAYLSVDAGTYESWAGSTTADVIDGHVSGAAGSDTFKIYKAYLDTASSFWGHNAKVQLGRVGAQYTPLTFKAQNSDTYVNLTQNTSGDAIVDGFNLVYGEGATKANIVAGKISTDYALSANAFYANGDSRPGAHLPGSTDVGGGLDLDPNYIDNIGGVHITNTSIRNWNVGLTGLFGRTTGNWWLTGNHETTVDPSSGKTINNFAIFGADLQGDLPWGVKFSGEFAEDDTGLDSSFASANSTNENQAWYGNLIYKVGALNLKAGYEWVEAYYDAPGYYQRIGSWTNPNNIRGVNGEISYAVSPKLGLSASGGSYQGIKTVDNIYHTPSDYSPLTGDDKLVQAVGKINYAATAKDTIGLSYEWVQYNLKANSNAGISEGKPVQSFATFEVAHKTSDNSSLRLEYQALQYQDKDTGFGNGDSHGGIFLTQFNVKF
jgi:hypothetical protein